jgi:transposase
MASLIEGFMTEKRPYRQYPREFKEEAVALISDQGYSVQKAADSLGIRSNVLYRWQRQLDDQKSGKSPSENERAELEELRKEVRELRMEKTILKKASALFAKEMK